MTRSMEKSIFFLTKKIENSKFVVLSSYFLNKRCVTAIQYANAIISYMQITTEYLYDERNVWKKFIVYIHDSLFL